MSLGDRSPPAPAPFQRLCPRPLEELMPSSAKHLGSSAPATTHTLTGWHRLFSLAEQPSAPFLLHKRLGTCVSLVTLPVQPLEGRGPSWSFPLRSAVPSPKQAIHQILNNTVLNELVPSPLGASNFDISICCDILGFVLVEHQGRKFYPSVV